MNEIQRGGMWHLAEGIVLFLVGMVTSLVGFFMDVLNPWAGMAHDQGYGYFQIGWITVSLLVIIYGALKIRKGGATIRDWYD